MLQEDQPKFLYFVEDVKVLMKTSFWKGLVLGLILSFLIIFLASIFFG